FFHRGEDVLEGNGVDDVEDLLDLRLRVDQQHAAVAAGEGAAGARQRAQAGAADVVEAFQVQHYGGHALVGQQRFDGVVQFRVAAGIQAAADGDALDSVLRGRGVDPELAHHCFSPD